MERLPVERLRQYLRQLSPAARALLVTELERSVLRGDAIPGGDLVLQAVRSIVRESGEQAPRIGNPARLLFEPVEPFLIDVAPTQKHQCRIARTSLEPIWIWICRDLAPAEAKMFTDEVSRALVLDEAAKRKRLSFDFQDLVAARIGKILSAAESDEKARRRLAAQLGTAGILDDLNEVVKILKARDALAMTGDRLPPRIHNFADAALDRAKSVLDAPAARREGVFPYALVLLMRRLAAPWQLIRLAIRVAQSDESTRIAASPYAVAVTIVLADIARMADELRTHLKRGTSQPAISLLKGIHDAVRGVRTELDLPADQQWGRELAAIRAEISSVLTTAIEPAPGWVRRLLRPRPVSEIKSGSVLDAQEVAECAALIELVGVCRIYAGELAISEVTTRAYGELEQFLDSGTRILLDGLRIAGPADRPFRRSQVDAAMRFCGKVFGQEYASLLAKAAEVASYCERKTPA